MKLWMNGTFYTMKQEGQKTDCVLTDQGKIIATGQEAKTAARNAEVIDLHGCFIFPGFTDSHMHLLWYGQALDRLNLFAYTSKKDCLEAIAERAAALADDGWLFVEGYDDNRIHDNGTLLTRHDLDPISRTQPILVRRIDCHTVSVNTAFLRQIGVKRNQVFPGGGKIDLDADGYPTGVLRDDASMLALERVPKESSEKLGGLLKTAVRDLWQKGLVGAHSEDLHYFNGFTDTVRVFRRALSADFPFRAHLLVHHRELDACMHAPEAITAADAFVSLGAVKIFYDGTIGSHTALMTRPYANEPNNHGQPFHTTVAFARIVRQARDAGRPVAVHIIGDRAFAEVIAILKAMPPRPGQKDRMIHTPWLRPYMLEEARGMPLVFDIQPQFMSSDLPWALDVLGKDFPPLAFAWKTIHDHGFTLAGGSDAPIEVPNPFFAIHAAVTRTAGSNVNGRRFFPAESLSVFDALALYTTGSAVACGRADQYGTIEPGKAADFTVVDRDPFTVAPDDLRHIAVCRTIVNEQIVFSR